MTKISSPSDIRALGTILSVWAHPDDESYSCAGIMALAVANGQKVVCLTATRGEKGVQDESKWPSKHLGEIRSREMVEALKIIGVSDHYWLNYIDGECDQAKPEQAAATIAKYIDDNQVDSILTFGPDGMTGHPDHQAVSRWVKLAVKVANRRPVVYHAVELEKVYNSIRDLDEKFNIFFNIDKPPLVSSDECNICLKLESDTLDKKYRCLCAMPSQTEKMFKEFGKDRVCQMISHETFIRAN